MKAKLVILSQKSQLETYRTNHSYLASGLVVVRIYTQLPI